MPGGEEECGDWCWSEDGLVYRDGCDIKGAVLRAGEVCTAGEGRAVVYSGIPGLFLLVRTGVVRLSEEGVACSLMGVALSVGWVSDDG